MIRSPLHALLLLLATAALSLLVALCFGSITLSPAQVWQSLWNTTPDVAGSLAHTVVLQLRLPRALDCFALGGLLALAGMFMQVLLRNPLADPYVLGTSGGAAVAALLALLFNLSGWWVQGAATVGAFASIVLVFALAHAEGSWSPTRLLLSGVIVASGAGALISVILALGDDTQLRSMVFWLMGDVAPGRHRAWLWTLWLCTGVLSVLLARQLNVLARGEVQATALGMNVTQCRMLLFLLTSLLTATAVTSAGSIGFIGLLTPHLGRLWVGADHRRLSVVVMMLGGAILTIADTAARSLFAPRQLPVGALTALIGVPLFLVMMLRRRA